MGFVIAALVGLGLLAYLAASFVGVGDGPDRKTATVGDWIRWVLGGLHSAAPLLLAVIWIGYGVLHLSSPVPSELPAPNQGLSTAHLQIPRPLWPLLAPLWYGSGAIEVAMGLLVVQARWRRWSLLAQMAMLIALVPFVVHLLGSDDALTDLLPGLTPPVARVVVVVHNLLLFVWVARLYRDELKRRATQARPQGATAGSLPPSAFTSSAKPKLQPVVIIAFVMLAANIAGCSTIAVAPWMSGSLYLWAMGSLATGALVGFLFGVPRWVAAKGQAAAVERTRYEPNTNIEQLSDWLTKMLVGLGLVQLHKLGPTISEAAAVLAQGLTLRPGRLAAPGEAQSFATGLVAYFLVAGLIQGFLLTRMFIARAWNEEAQTTPGITR